MTNNHLSESAIQLFAVDKESMTPEASAHLQGCSTCREKVSAYTLLFNEIESLPKPSFAFDLADLVVAQLPKSKVPSASNPASSYLIAAAAFLALALPIHFYWHYFSNLFLGMIPIVLYLIIITAITFIICQCVEFYRKYERKMNILNME
jgi:hypothetical protein